MRLFATIHVLNGSTFEVRELAPHSSAFIEEIGSVIAPILLPLFSLLTAFFDAPAPVMEWDVVEQTSSSCSIDLHLAVLTNAELSKLSLVPHDASPNLSVSTSFLPSDDHWLRDNVWSWMWYDAPNAIEVNMQVDWSQSNPSGGDALVDVTWEHVVDGQRSQWTLGTVRLPIRSEIETLSSVDQADAVGARRATALDSSQTDVTLEVSDVPEGAFVKWTEYIPEGCTCDVIDDAGASLRQTLNTQIFLWFQTESPEPLRPIYRLRCAQAIEKSTLEGTLEVAFGTRTKTTDIAETVWTESDSLLNETMRLNQPSDPQSDADAGDSQIGVGIVPASGQDVAFAVQLLANHRDLSANEWTENVGFHGQTHTIRHEGWHKHLTDNVSTYAKARAMRSDIWASTAATDAFVTASLEGERITVQEALLISDQTWIP